MTAVLFVVTCLISEISPNGRRIFLSGDGLVQLAEMGKMYARKLLGGQNLQYSFEIGLGMPTSAIYAYYTLSPFTLLYRIIPDVDTASYFIVLLKQMTAAFFMSVLLQKWMTTDGLTAAFLSTAYALCGFFANFFTVFIFLDVMYLCPMLLLTMLYFFQTGKIWKMTLVYASSFIIQFYSAYIMSVFSVTIFIVLAFFSYGKDKKRWGWGLLRYGGAVVLAALLSAPVTLPAAMELLSIRGNDIEEQRQIVLSLRGFLLGLYPGMGQGTQNTIPMLYAGLPVLLLTIGYFAGCLEMKQRKAIMFIPLLFLLICSVWRPAYIMIHAFDQPNGYAFRYAWAASFWMIIIAAKEIGYLRQVKEVCGLRYLIAVICGVTYMIIRLLFSPMAESAGITERMSSGILILGTCFLYAFLAGIAKKDALRLAVGGLLLCIELIINLRQGRETIEGILNERTFYDLWQEQAEMSFDYIQKMEQVAPSAFYRIRYYNSITDNISMLYGFHGLGYFNSIENTALRELLKNYGYATAQSIVFDYGSTRLMQMLFSQKYSVECGYFEGEHPEYFTVYVNEFVLPLGFVVSDEFAEYQTTESDPFLAQNALISAMTGKKMEIYNSPEESIRLKADGVNLDIQEAGTRVSKAEPGTAGSACYMISDMGTDRVYGYMARWGASMVTHESIPLLCSDMDIGGQLHRSMAVMPHIIPMACGADGVYRLYLQMPADGPDVFDYERISFAGENTEQMQRAYEMLRAGEWKLSSFSDEQIIGTVSAKEGQSLLFTTIPYDPGWEVFVDGEKVAAEPIWDDVFLAVPLPPGEHEVQLNYIGNWNRYGIGIGIIGGMLLVIVIIFETRRKKRKRDVV
ncbi:MAG: YfhO family protein [Lachnospiraceae bacterium]|nr:YfhO family protein [Lachnospiraceae bacterium]